MPFEIVQIPRDDASIRLYVEQYKAFRLLALKTDPDSFGSTYAREIAFTEDTWYKRLANPQVTTFLAFQEGQVVCTVSIAGPLPCTPEESSPSKDPWTILSGNPEATTQSHWRIIGMFTRPAARGQGIAKAIIAKALQHAMGEAANAGKNFVATIAVEHDNPAAVGLYKKCGFETIIEEPWFLNRPRIALLMKCSTPSGIDKASVEQN
ncbi:acyl-CoA N-acyltransferase [Hyaloscypha variabilis F]|uniref:Acyl-CoA N-acyltransferase n=1 Tax=Hyaloscypha variabilis (strain UAMH 11265 / GT02V1 / F) TaxID=1149755 RepID=A0A2J6SCI9_HYAVF|nr:acyl-CoA N-acyltransferase [Hyaloscypha variabilis F]